MLMKSGLNESGGSCSSNITIQHAAALKPTPLAEGPAVRPAAVAPHGPAEITPCKPGRATSAQSTAFPPLEFRHPGVIAWNLSFSIKPCRITLAANPCDEAADAASTDLVYPFKQPEHSHHHEKSGPKPGKIPHGTDKKEGKADRIVFSSAGRRETSARFYSSEEGAQESAVVSLRSARRQAGHLIRSRAKQQQEGDMGSPGTEENGAAERARD